MLKNKKYIINILGTGHASAVNCYNACFTISKNNKHFLVDSGGGNGILRQLKKGKIKLESIRYVFISHIHMDHIMGIIWVIRRLMPKYHKKDLENIIIFGHDEVIKIIKELFDIFIPNDFKYLLDNKIKFIIVDNNSEYTIFDKKILFFDINANKVKQFGFKYFYDNEKNITFIGDECCSKTTEKYIENCEYLFADAYTYGKKAEIINPMKSHFHSSVKYISEIAQNNKVKNLILSHTLDNNLIFRKLNFIKDGNKYFKGKIIVPRDMEKIYLK